MRVKLLFSASIILSIFIITCIYLLISNPLNEINTISSAVHTSSMSVSSTKSTQPEEIAEKKIRLGVDVQDEELKAIAGAKIDVQDATGSTRLSEVTNDVGFCSFDYSPSIHKSMVVSCSGFFDKRIDLSPVANQANPAMQVYLESKKRMAGIVVDCSGAAIRDARISIRKVDEDSDVSSNSPNEISSEQGLFSFSSLVSGHYILSVSHASYLPKTLECRTGDVQIRVILKNQSDIFVRTIDDRDNPIGGVEVTLASLNRESGIVLSTNRTGVSGEVMFLNLSPAKYSITAKAAFLGVSCATEVDVRQIDRIDVLLKLQPTPFTISGKVLEFKTNKPIESATVICRSQNKGNPSLFKQSTNSFGEFSFSDLFPGEYSLYLDELDGYMTGDTSSYKALGITPPYALSNYLSEIVPDVILWAKPCWILSGRVFNHKKEPLENAKVTISVVPERGSGYLGKQNMDPEVSTDINGRYELEGCFDLTKNTNVFVMAKHSLYGVKGSDVLRPEPGDRINDLDIVFDREFNLTGKVMDTAGKGISGASVYVYFKMGESVMPRGFQVTDAGGLYGMFVEPGVYAARAQASGYKMPDDEKTKKVDISGNETCTVNFKLEENQDSLKGIVIGENNVPVSRVDIYAVLYGDDRKPSSNQLGEKIDTTGEDGQFEIDSAKIDHWGECDLLKITAIQESPQEYEPASLYDIRLDSQNLTVELKEKQQDYPFEVYGTVLDTDDRPKQDFELLLFESSSQTFVSPPIDKQVYGWIPFHSLNGEFHLKGSDSRDGPFLIVARDADGSQAFSDPYHFSPGEVKTGVQIQFETPYTLSGRIVCEETGVPLQGAIIVVQYAVNPIEYYQKLQTPGYGTMLSMRQGDPRQRNLTGNTPQITSGEDGSFIINKLTASKVCLVVMHSGYRSSFNLISKREKGLVHDVGVIALKGIAGDGSQSNREPDVVIH